MAGKKVLLEKEKISFIISEYLKGKTMKSISEKVGVGVKKVRETLIENNIDVSIKRARIFDDEELKNIKNKYLEGASLEDLGKEQKIRISKLRDALVEYGVKIRKRGELVNKEDYKKSRKYVFNERYFEYINTQDKAYWLGFIYADGCINIRYSNNGNRKGGNLEIGLKKEDDYHLANFVKSVSGDMPIKYREKTLNGKTYESCRVVLCSIDMVEDLISHKCIPKKSLVLEFPNHLEENMVRHFIRGYIDGDGCICFYPEGRSLDFHVNILGTESFLNSIKINLENNDIKCADVRLKKQNLYEINIYGHNNLKCLYDYLYLDSNLFLGRKIDKFKKALIYTGKDFNNSNMFKMSLLLDDDYCEVLKNKNKTHLLD